MTVRADDFETLSRYAAGVMRRANHHAPGVAAIALALLGAIVWRGEPGSVEIRQHAGDLANVLWATIGGKRYAFVYNHETQEIEMRDRTVQGGALHRFSNRTPVADVEAIFRDL